MNGSTPPRARRGAGHRGLIAAAVLASGLALSGCGGGDDPLAKLTPPQRGELDAAWSAIINATDPAPFTETDRASRSKTLYTSCKALEPSNALLTAVSGACTPIYAVTKLDGVLPTRCATASALCTRALDRRATATDELVNALANLTAQATNAITDPACRQAFTTSPVMLQNYKNLASAYRVLSLGVAQKDKDISGLGQRQIDGAKSLIADRRTASQRMSAFRTGCGLNDG